MTPDEYAYEDYLAEGNEVYVNMEDLTSRLNYLLALQATYRRNIEEHMWVYSCGQVSHFNRDSLLHFLQRYYYVDESDLIHRKTRKLSVDKDQIIKPLMERRIELKDFLGVYLRYTELKSDIQKLSKIRDEFAKPTELVDKNGNPLHAIGFNYERQATGRYYTKNDGIQNYSKRYTDLLTVPEGYFLYWSDFHQIDLRVAYETILREKNPEADTIFQSTEDKYEAMARIMKHKAGETFNLDEFTSKRKAYKVGVLARTYGQAKYQISKATGDSIFAEMLEQYFTQNATYTTYLEKIKTLCLVSGTFTVTDYFGTERTVTVESNQSRTINVALNTPIQSTSNSIVMHYTNAVLGRFREMGFDADKISLYLNRHDEVVFMIHESMKPYLWMIEDLSTVQVDSWATLTMEPQLGFNYGIENPKLQETLYQNIIDNSTKFTKGVTHERNEQYSPVKEVFRGTIIIQNNRIICVKDTIAGNKFLTHAKPFETKPLTEEEIVDLETSFTKAIINRHKDEYQYYVFNTLKVDDSLYVSAFDCYITWNKAKIGGDYVALTALSNQFPEEVITNEQSTG